MSCLVYTNPMYQQSWPAPSRTAPSSRSTPSTAPPSRSSPSPSVSCSSVSPGRMTRASCASTEDTESSSTRPWAHTRVDFDSIPPSTCPCKSLLQFHRLKE